MDHDVDAGWSDRSAVEIELSMDLGPSREVGIHPGPAEEVES
jgi:hypothetical protein